MNKYSFSPEFLADLKSRNDIVSIISSSIAVQKRGRYYWACCPFHIEKTPSFSISEDEQYYHCYGCGESGDVISFVEKYENLTFLEAVKLLCKSAGMELPNIKQDDKEMERLKQKERVLRALNDATEFYISKLNSPQGNIAMEYAKSRHFDEDVIKHFHIGYSPDFSSLLTYFRDKKVSVDVLKDAGLVEMSSYGNYYDVFAGRLIFPVLNSYGDTIAYTARTMEKDPQYAKYRNSTQTMVFDKSKTVYNINTIKELKKSGTLAQVYILEGTVDVIAMYRAGIKNAVACLGTAITSEHAKVIKKYVDKVVLCLDGDSAGQKAMYKAIDILMDGGLEVKVVKLRDNLDPDEYLNTYGKEALIEEVSHTMDAIEYEIRSIEDRYDLQDSFGRGKFVSDCLALLSKLTSKSQQDIYLRIVSDISRVSIDVLRRDMLSSTDGLYKKNNDVDAQNMPQSAISSDVKAVKFILASLVHKKPYSTPALENKLQLKNGTLSRLYDFLVKCHKDGKTFTISTLCDYFDVDSEPMLRDIIGFDFDKLDDEERYFCECMKSLNSTSLKEEQKRLLALYSQEIDIDKKREIIKEIDRITKEIKTGDIEDV